MASDVAAKLATESDFSVFSVSFSCGISDIESVLSAILDLHWTKFNNTMPYNLACSH